MYSSEVVINNLAVKVRAGSVRVSKAIRQRPVAEFDVLDSWGVVPTEGQQAGVFDLGLGVFSGTIHEVKRKPALAKPSAPAWYHCVCTGWQHRAEKRRVTVAVFDGMTAAEAVTALIANWATNDIQIGYVGTGGSAAQLGRLIYVGSTIAEILDDLADRSGYIWWIDRNINLYFCPSNYSAATLEVTSENANYREPEISSTRADYFNKVTIAINHDAFTQASNTFAGDQVSPSFQVTNGASPANLLPIDTIVRITLNSVEQTVGLNVAGATATFLYTQGSATITYNPLYVPPAAEDVVVVDFYPLGANLITVQDDDEIAARAAIESDSGIYHAFVEDQECHDATAGTAHANEFLDLHAPARVNGALAAGTMPREYKWSMYSHELRQGVTKFIEDAEPGKIIRFKPSTPTTEDVQVVIQSIEIASVEGSIDNGQGQGAGIFRYDITAIDCVKLSNDMDLYRAMAEVAKTKTNPDVADSDANVTINGSPVTY